MERILCRVCGRFLGWGGVMIQFHSAPCKSCKAETTVNKIAGDINEAINFEFDEEAMKKADNRQVSN